MASERDGEALKNIAELHQKLAQVTYYDPAADLCDRVFYNPNRRVSCAFETCKRPNARTCQRKCGLR